MTSDEAVEAAAKATWQRTRVDPWENNTDYLAVEVHRADARPALEAAAPHMLAEALESAADELDRLESLGRIPWCDLSDEQRHDYRVFAEQESEQIFLRERAAAIRNSPH